MVLSEYVFKSARYLLTVSRLAPVLAIIVCTLPILSSYSLNPSVIGCIASDETRCLPVLITELVMFDKAVIAMVCNAENLTLIPSTDDPNASKPFAAPLIFRPLFNLSMELREVFTFLSKSSFLNCISTTLWSIVDAISQSPPSKHYLTYRQKHLL